MGEFDEVFITMFHRPTADVICLRSSKMRPVVQLRLRLVAFSESDEVDSRSDDVQER